MNYVNEEVSSYRYLGSKIYTIKLKEDMVETLCNYDEEVINKTFKNKMKKEISLKLHNVTSKLSLFLEVKLLTWNKLKQKQHMYILLSFVVLNLKRQMTNWTNEDYPCS
jgi:hypothetical protein